MIRNYCYGCMKEKSDHPVCEHCGYDERTPNAPHQLAPGTLLREQYLIGRVLGQGGFGITYLGRDIKLNIPIAIKEYYPTGIVSREASQDPYVSVVTGDLGIRFRENRTRFLREAQTLAQLQDIPEVVQVMNFFEEHNTAYIIMGYVRGITLKDHLASRGGRLPATEVFRLLEPLMGAMSRVHEAGLVHRDISPDNIMITSNGRVRLIDFGAAHQASGDDGSSTLAVLKHGFAPMEQYQTRGRLGPWTDVYALCATIYHCLTGRKPPTSTDRIMGEDDFHWDHIPGLTPAQKAALVRGVALNYKERIQSMEELRQLLFQKSDFSGTIPLRRKPEGPFTAPVYGGGYTAPLHKEPPHTAPASQESREESDGHTSKTTVRSAISGAMFKLSSKPLLYALVFLLAFWMIPRIFNIRIPTAEPSHTHTWTAATCSTPKTCTDCGETQGKPAGHQWIDATCTAPMTCSVCADTFGGTTDHVWKEATYYAPMTCTVCGETKGEPRQPEIETTAETEPNRMTAPPCGMVAAGTYHSVHLLPDGTVYAVGKTANSRCDTLNWTDIVAVSASEHTVGLRKDGTVVAVGSNDDGKCNVSSWRDIIAIDTGPHHTVGLRSDGTVVAVGNNSHGQCDVSRWKNIVDVAASEQTTYGLTADGRVLCAGRKNYGSDWTDIIDIDAGPYHLVALKRDGTVIQKGGCDIWDEGTDGWKNITAISAGNSSTVGLRSDGRVVAVGGNTADKGQCDVSSWRDIVAISSGMYHTLGIRSDGSVVGAGSNGFGQLGVMN